MEFGAPKLGGRGVASRSLFLLLQILVVLVSLTVAQVTPSYSPTARPTPTADYATLAPTGAATITHNPDWTEAQLISVVVGSVLGLSAVVLAVYCAYARGCCEDGPKYRTTRTAELPSQSSPLLPAAAP